MGEERYDVAHVPSATQALEIMDSLVIGGSEALDVRDAAAVAARIKGSVSSKQFGYEDLLCPLIAEACIGVCPKNPASFNVDNVRCKWQLLDGIHMAAVM